jgi:hypothetical protein
VARYRVDPDRSEVSAVARPALGEGPLAATITGSVEIADVAGHGEPADVAGHDEHAARVDDRPLAGSVRISVAVPGHPSAGVIEVDLAATRPELDRGPDGDVLLRGSTTRPATEFGQFGPPLLNPTIVLRWRAVLVPDEP